MTYTQTLEATRQALSELRQYGAYMPLIVRQKFLEEADAIASLLPITSLEAEMVERVKPLSVETFLQAMADERERCAKVAENFDNNHRHGPAITPERYRKDIATAIRSLSASPTDAGVER